MLFYLLDHMYFFEGKDYSKDPSSDDQKRFDLLLEEQLAEFQRADGEGRALRHKAGVRFCHFNLILKDMSHRYFFDLSTYFNMRAVREVFI